MAPSGQGLQRPTMAAAVEAAELVEVAVVAAVARLLWECWEIRSRPRRWNVSRQQRCNAQLLRGRMRHLRGELRELG